MGAMSGSGCAHTTDAPSNTHVPKNDESLTISLLRIFPETAVFPFRGTALISRQLEGWMWAQAKNDACDFLRATRWYKAREGHRF